jgi:RimJ/RimL family protein N-acetyltransferase
VIVLETERLYLRQWVPDDWVRFKPLLIDPRVTQYVPERDWTDERIQSKIREYTQQSSTRGWTLWPVIHRADSRFIGFCGFGDEDSSEVGIGWRLLPEYWGQGLATEAAAATLQHGFSTWGFPIVSAHAQTPNKASIRVMEKIGMTYDGTGKLDGFDVVRYVAQNPRVGVNNAATDAIQIRDTRDIPKEAVLDLYRSVDWSSAKKPNELYQALVNSHSLITAWDGDRLIGLANTISDGFLVVYHPHFVVHPEYQRKGIGREMMARLMQSYRGFHQQSVIADRDAVAFYEKCGFEQSVCTAMWIYDGDDH